MPRRRQMSSMYVDLVITLFTRLLGNSCFAALVCLDSPARAEIFRPGPPRSDDFVFLSTRPCLIVEIQARPGPARLRSNNNMYLDNSGLPCCHD